MSAGGANGLSLPWEIFDTIHRYSTTSLLIILFHDFKQTCIWKTMSIICLITCYKIHIRTRGDIMTFTLFSVLSILDAVLKRSHWKYYVLKFKMTALIWHLNFDLARAGFYPVGMIEHTVPVLKVQIGPIWSVNNKYCFFVYLCMSTNNTGSCEKYF